MVEELAACPARFAELWACLTCLDPLVRMRAADALEKYSRDCPAAFDGYKDALLAQALDDGSAEVRWHLIAITSRLRLRPAEVRHFVRYLHDRLRNDASRIVKVTALQAAADLSGEPTVAAEIAEMLAFAESSAWPSVAARARKIALTRGRP